MEFKVQQGFSDYDSAGVASRGEVSRLLLAMKEDFYSVHFDRVTVESFLRVLEIIQGALPSKSRVQSTRPYEALVTMPAVETFFFVQDQSTHSALDPCEISTRHLYICGYGNLTLISKVMDRLNSEIKPDYSKPSLTWVYFNKGDRLRASISPARALPVHSEFYPWMGDINNYYDQYLASESPVLILLGPPGTAKTSFIRSLIWRDNLATVFTYDEDLMKSDGMFVEFITGKDELLVVEDADLFLTDRERGGNAIMSKFLNISDGLAASSKRKKIIFTANIVEPSRIDPALLRPGRCFDCQVFRKLTATEAEAAAKVAKLSFRPEGQHYSLAEIFARGKGEPEAMRPTKTGFGR